MNIKILIGFIAGAAIASVGTYWVAHRPAAIVAQAPAPVQAPVTPPVEVPSKPPEPLPEPSKEAPAAPKAVVKKEKARSPKPLAIDHPLPHFVDPSPFVQPAAAPAPVEIAIAPPVVQAPAPQPAPDPIVTNPADDVKAIAPPAPNSVTIAPGTMIAVRIGETLSSKRNHQGDSFIGTLDHELDVNGFVIAEKGSRVEGRVAAVEEAGRVRGLARLAIELTRMHTSDGQTVSIRTAQFEKMGPQSKREDAEKVGIGTILGAVIGAAAGGGKGAAVGAGVGAGAGAGTVAATRGKPAEIPVETVVSFKLDQPVTITEKVQ